jgi:hypothetical protein
MTYRGKSFAAKFLVPQRPAMSVLPVYRRAHGALCLLFSRPCLCLGLLSLHRPLDAKLLYHKWRYLKKPIQGKRISRTGNRNDACELKAQLATSRRRRKPPRPPRPLRISTRTECTRAFGCPVWTTLLCFYSDSLVSVSQTVRPASTSPFACSEGFSLFLHPHSSIHPICHSPGPRGSHFFQEEKLCCMFP